MLATVVMSEHTLLLNSWMLPHRIIPWQEAITLWYLGKVVVCSTSADQVLTLNSSTA